MSIVERFREISIFFLVIFCGIPLVPVVALAWLWKTIVQIIVSLFYKKLNLTFLQVTDSIFYGQDQINSYFEPKQNILLNFVLDGQLCLEDVRNRVQKNAIEARGSDGTLTFLRLQQRLFKKLGYVFLGLDQNFNIANHITEAQISLNEDSLYDFLRIRSSAPYHPNSPLWEMLLVPNYNSENKTYLLIRSHHLIMDGFSLVQFTKAISDNGQASLEGLKIPAKTLSYSSTKFERLTNLYKRTVALPRKYFIEKSTRPIMPNFANTEIGFLKVINKIPLQKFKDFKKQTNVSLTESLLYATSSAMTECFTYSGTVECTTSLPLPTTGKTIGNNFILADINLPVGSMTLEERVQQCQVQLQKTKTSVSPIVNAMKYTIGTIFPTSIFLKYFPAKKIFILLSNTPGPSTPTSILGLYPTHLFPAFLINDFPIIFIMPMSYNGDLIISLSGLPHLFPNQEKFIEFVNYFENGLNTLLNSTNFSSIQSTSEQVVKEIVVMQ